MRALWPTPRFVLPFVLAVFALGCKSSDDGDDGDPNDPNDPGPDFWLVGDEGNMFGVSAGGEASTYPLEHEEDLLAIACHGEATAWVVGTGATVLRSRDAGHSWDAVALPGALGEASWRALAVAEATPEGLETLWFVGEAGVVAHTVDGGQSWTGVDIVGPTATLTGVATRAAGERAVAVDRTGGIWALEDGAAELLHSAEGPLLAVAMAAHDPRVVAVGETGLMLASDDAGLTWGPVELPTTHDLHAVRVAGHDDLQIAVGEAGLIVRVEDGEVGVDQIPDAELGLFGLHLRDDGRGQAVGGGGTLLRTADAGLTWTTISLPTTATLRAVDDFHAGGHL